MTEQVTTTIREKLKEQKIKCIYELETDGEQKLLEYSYNGTSLEINTVPGTAFLVELD